MTARLPGRNIPQTFEPLCEIITRNISGQAHGVMTSSRTKPAIHLCSHVGQAFRPACERDLQG